MGIFPGVSSRYTRVLQRVDSGPPRNVFRSLLLKYPHSRLLFVLPKGRCGKKASPPPRFFSARVRVVAPIDFEVYCRVDSLYV